MHRTKLDRSYRMETLHILEAVFCDPCKNRVRAFSERVRKPSVFLGLYPEKKKRIFSDPFPSYLLPCCEDQDTRCFAAFFTTKLGQGCSRFSLLMNVGELSPPLLIVFQRDRLVPSSKFTFCSGSEKFPCSCFGDLPRCKPGWKSGQTRVCRWENGSPGKNTL